VCEPSEASNFHRPLGTEETLSLQRELDSNFLLSKVVDASYNKNAQKNLHIDYNKMVNDVIDVD
jgi:hypothetical protein